jgi:peptidyl-prolyl cis-trans isomerase C
MQWKYWLMSVLASATVVGSAQAEDVAKKVNVSVDAPAVKVEAKAPQAKMSPDAVILKVDGEEIKKAQVMTSWNSMFPKDRAPDFDTIQPNIRDNVLRGVATEQLIYKRAASSGVDESAEFKAKMEQIKQKVLTQVFLEKEANSRVTEADIRKRLDAENAKLKDKKQAHARHILVKTKEEAQDILKKLKAGEKFEELAKKLSVDTGSGVKGGDLGFFTADAMVPEFSKAVFAMKAGQTSDPVETSFGWHVIKLEEVKPVPPLTYEAAKDSIGNELKSKALETFVDEVVAKAKIIAVDADGKERSLEAVPVAKMMEEKK